MKFAALSVLLIATLLTGCSLLRPWHNAAAIENSATVYAPPNGHSDSTDKQPPVVVALTLSGGGARAAAFGLGVLPELKATRFVLDGKETTLLDALGLISGVSGGSILAAHYAMFGDETLTRFESDFLLEDFDGGLIKRALSFSRFRDLASPWYGRSNVLEERLSVLYRGKTFADLAVRKSGSRLLVTATDLTTGAPFEFTPEVASCVCMPLRLRVLRNRSRAAGISGSCGSGTTLWQLEHSKTCPDPLACRTKRLRRSAPGRVSHRPASVSRSNTRY